MILEGGCPVLRLQAVFSLRRAGRRQTYGSTTAIAVVKTLPDIPTLAVFIQLPKGRPLHSPFGLRHLRTTLLRRQRSTKVRG